MAKLEMIVPRYYNDGTPVPEMAFDALDQFFSDEFGGYSRSEISGGWRDPESGKMMRDQSFRYEVYADQLDKSLVSELAQIVKGFWEQKSVFYTVDGAPVFA